jgi:hypothetical protein
MKIKVDRRDLFENYTIGKMYVDGVDIRTFTLEPTVRASGVKIPGKTAIPAGTYQVIVSFSNHFQKDLPLLTFVPGFDGVRIHPGNTDADTEGCILVGRDWNGQDFVGHSRDCFEDLFHMIKEALAKGDDVALEIG